MESGLSKESPSRDCVAATEDQSLGGNSYLAQQEDHEVDVPWSDCNDEAKEKGGNVRAAVLGADVTLAGVVAVFKDSGLDINVLDSACESENGESGGDMLGVNMLGVDTPGVDTPGVDDHVDALVGRGEDRLGMDVVAGTDLPCFEGEIGNNCVSVDVFVFEGKEQQGSEVSDSTGIAEEHPLSRWQIKASMIALMNVLRSLSSCPGPSLC